MGRKLLLPAALHTTADALIVHAEIGPEFVPEISPPRSGYVGSERIAGYALAARSAGFPHVVSIVGFDDIPATAAAGLTTIRQDTFLKGQLAVKVLLDGYKPPLMPVGLIVRDT